nr:hypothetical protein [Tanacetum cinerariifolium]
RNCSGLTDGANLLVQNMLRVDEMDLDNYWAGPMGISYSKSSKKMSSCTIRGKTLPVSKLGCVLSQDFIAFYLEDFLRFVSRPLRFVSRMGCVLSQDLLRFVSRPAALYCRGKENGVNILKSIDEGPYQMGTVREPLAEGTEGTPQFSPERPRVYSDLSPEEKDRYNADLRASNILLQGLPKDIYTLINHYTDAKDIWDNAKMLLEGSELTKEDRESQLNIKMTMSRMQLNSKFVNKMLPEWGRFVTAVKLNRGVRDSNYDQLSGDESTSGGATVYGGVQNRVGNANPGQARQTDDCDAFNSDMDEAPTAQTMFMANLSSVDPVTDEAEPSYDSDILSEVRDHDHYQDAVCAHHKEHAMHDSVQLNHVVDLQADYTSDSNMISYDQYVKDNEVPVVHSDVSSVPNNAFMMIYNDMCEPHARSIFNHSWNAVVKNSLTAELATYKEQVELYERRAKFELTEREHVKNT